jgi:hypothetical protein
VLNELHAAVQRLVHEHGQVPADEVDVRFDAPRRDWVAALTRPTLSFFLFDVQENTDLRHTNLETTRGNDRAVHRVPPRRFDLHYMVSALTTAAEDEHVLLWRTLVTLLEHPAFPDDLLSPELRLLDPAPTTQVRSPEEGSTMLDLWSSLETPPHPALLYVVTVPLDLAITRRSPLVLTRTARYARALAADAPGPEVRTHIGGVVRGRRGEPHANARVSVEGSGAEGVVTRADGTFVLHGVPAGTVTLRVARDGRPPTLTKVEIPSESYQVVVD